MYVHYITLPVSLYCIRSLHHTDILFYFCSTLNLAQECLETDFIRQIRGHGLTNNILLLLKDALDHPVRLY